MDCDVAEIIGWDVRGAQRINPRPQVDDLLAWLQKHLPRDFVFGEDHEPGSYFFFACWRDGHADPADGRWEIDIVDTSFRRLLERGVWLVACHLGLVLECYECGAECDAGWMAGSGGLCDACLADYAIPLTGTRAIVELLAAVEGVEL